jgi:hypothetical protein
MRASVAIMLTTLGIVAATQSACAPCASTAECGRTVPHIDVQGRLLTTESGIGVAAADILLVAIYAGGRDTARTTTDDAGIFSISLFARSERPARVALVVAPPSAPAYTVDSLPCKTSTRHADGCVIPPLAERPRPPRFEFRYRNDFEKPIQNARVSFRRRAGFGIYGTGADNCADSATDTTTVYEAVTDTRGTAILFPGGCFVEGAGPVVGELRVELPALGRVSVHPAYRIRPDYWFGPHGIAVQPVGPSLSYTTLFSDSATKGGRPGVVIRFERTAGVHALPDTFSAASREDGWTGLDMRPVGDGTIEGDLTIAVPGNPAVVRYTGLRLATFDADSVVFWGHWLVGKTGMLYPLRPFPP